MMNRIMFYGPDDSTIGVLTLEFDPETFTVALRLYCGPERHGEHRHMLTWQVDEQLWPGSAETLVPTILRSLDPYGLIARIAHSEPHRGVTWYTT